MTDIFYSLACLSAGSSVALKAFGSHKLKKHANFTAWKSATNMQMMNSLAILVSLSTCSSLIPATLIATGTAMFSGSIYVLLFKPKKYIGVLTPIGGVTIMCGWISMAYFGRIKV